MNWTGLLTIGRGREQAADGGRGVAGHATASAASATVADSEAKVRGASIGAPYRRMRPKLESAAILCVGLTTPSCPGLSLDMVGGPSRKDRHGAQVRDLQGQGRRVPRSLQVQQRSDLLD